MVTVDSPVQAEAPDPAPAQTSDADAALERDSQHGDDIMPAAESNEGTDPSGLTPYDGQTEDGAYSISTAEQLKLLSTTILNSGESYSGSTFTLTNDISLFSVCGTDEEGRSVNWVPIGSREEYIPFSGEFNGNEHTISDLFISSKSTMTYQGLFGFTQDAYIHDLSVQGTITVGPNSVSIAGIVAVAESSDTVNIENCTSDVDITANSSRYLGGIVAYISEIYDKITIQNCENKGSISGANSNTIGGITGYLSSWSETTIYENCLNTGNITGAAAIGGIIGESSADNYSFMFQSCNNTGCITGTGSTKERGVGGIIGAHLQSAFTMRDCHNAEGATVSGASGVGGLVGTCLAPWWSSDCVVLENCSNEEGASVSGTGSAVGGVIAWLSHLDTNLNNCHNFGDVEGSDMVGGIIGEIDENTSTIIVSECNNEGQVHASNMTSGGIVGQIDAGANPRELDDCTNKGTVSSDHCNAGGIVGISKGAVLTRCRNEGTITAQVYGAGGIAADFSDGTLSFCRNQSTGIVKDNGTKSQSFAGGLIGIASNEVEIANSWNEGTVSGTYHVGGLLGMAGARPSSSSANPGDLPNKVALTLSNSRNEGNVVGTHLGGVYLSYIGGLVGLLHIGADSSAQVTRCYSTGEVSTDSTGAFTQVGGLFGCLTTSSGDAGNGKATIRYCYSTGQVMGANQVGGLIGRLASWENTSFGELELLNCYSASVVTTNGTIAQRDLQVGAAIGAAENTADGARFSNVFALEVENAAIGLNDGSLDGSSVTLLNDSVIKSSNMIALIGDAFVASSGACPTLAASSATPNKVNVQFYGAENTVVTINGLSTYAVAVDSGSSLTFTVTGKDSGITVKSVSAGGSTLSADAGSYTLSNITADTTVQVETEGTTSQPEVMGQKITFQFTDPSANPISGATVSVKSAGENDAEYVADTEGTYHLEDGTYTVTVSKQNYHELAGEFTVDGFDKNLKAVLYPESTQKSTLTVTLGGMGFYVDIYNGDLCVARSNDATYDEKTSTLSPLPAGDYFYSATGVAGIENCTWSGKSMGSGPLKLEPGNQAISLRFVNFVGGTTTNGSHYQPTIAKYLENSANSDYYMKIIGVDGEKRTEYFPGSTSADGEYCRGYAVLPSDTDGAEYYFEFVPRKADCWGSRGTLYLYTDKTEKTFAGLNTSDSALHFLIQTATTQTITVPAGAELSLFYRHKLYEPPEIITEDTKVSDGGMDTYTFTVPKRTLLQYEVMLEGYVKYGDQFTTDERPLVIDLASMMKTPEEAPEDSEGHECNILTSAPDSKSIKLQVGQTFELHCFRNWQAIGSGTANDYAEPTYHFEVISGGEFITLENTYYAGTFIKAQKQGVAFVRVTYDDLYYHGHLFPRLAERNAIVIAVNVDGPGAATINSGISQKEFEMSYFTRSINGVPQDAGKCYAEYTFTPEVLNGSLAKVEIHAPVGNKGVWDNSAWTEIEPNADQSYTAHLVEGRSMIRLTATDGTLAFYSLHAAGLDITMDGVPEGSVTQKDGKFAASVDAGTVVKLSFKGLEMPFPKLGAIYNPGYEQNGPGTTYVRYILNGTATLESSPHTQYNISTVNEITINALTSAGTYNLTKGAIHTTSIGEAGGMHRGITRGGFTGGSFVGVDSSGNAPEADLGFLSILPDLEITVIGKGETGDKHTATFTVPSDTKRITIFNNQGFDVPEPEISGSVYTYELADNGGGEGAQYIYAVERGGYITKTGTFTVGEQAFTLDLTAKSSWTPISQSGTVTVSVIGDFAVPVTSITIDISGTPQDLCSKNYVDYNHGGYTVLHALLDAFGTAVTSNCIKGVLTPANISTKTAGGAWICSVNNVKVEDYANTLVKSGDQIVFYYKTAAQTQRAWFRETEVTAAKDGSVTVTVMSVPADNTAANQAGTPIQGASIYIDGKNWGAKTGSDGTATLSGLNSLAKGAHTITAQTDAGTLTFARCILTITDTQGGTSSGDAISVTFRLIGDEARGAAAYDQYVNWIGTTTCELPKGSKVGDLFTRVLSANGFTYEGAESNYVKSITIPTSLGGYKLSEMQNGPASGWMYTVNGTHPDKGLNEWTLCDGDEVIWHYVNSGVEGTDADSWYVNPWLFAADTAPGTSPSVPSGSAEVTSVKFGERVLTKSGTTFILNLAAGETAPTDGSVFTITLADETATKTGPVKKGDGWEFTVTPKDGAAVTYTITVSVTSEDPTPSTPLTSTLKYLANNVTNPTVGSTGGEWAVLAQARGNALADAAKQAYLTNLWHYANELNGVLDEYGFSHTEYSRVILALTSIGVDASAVKNGGKTYDFVAPLLDKDCLQVIEQGNNGTAFALIALDSGSYLNNAEGKKARAAWIDSLATEQNADGSWPILSGQAGSIDITAMAVQALAPYYKDASKLSALGTVNTTHAKLKSMVDSAVAWLAKQSGNNYGSCEAAAQMLVAMTALGSQEYADKALESLLTYQIGSTGSFCNKAGGGANQMSTEQAAYALVAYDRFKNSKNSLYNMTDVTLSKADLNITSAQYTITVNSGANGKIEPSSATVTSGANKTFTITPNNGYQIKDVMVDGVSIGGQSTYTFTNVTSNHTISAEFEVASGSHTITVSSSAGGTISPSTATVTAGGSRTFTITPFTGYKIMDVKVDGYSIGAQTSYTFTNVSSNHTITATFAAAANDITVYFTLLGDSAHGDSTSSVHTLSNGGLQTWIPRQAVTVSAGSKVYDVFTKVLNQYGYSYIGAEQNYVKTIVTPSGTRLSEFTNGRNSGWMYTVNGTHPDQGLQAWTVYNGDEIIWHYTDDYTQERGGTGTSSTNNGAAQLTPTVSGSNSTVSSSDFYNAVTAAINSNSGTILIAPQGSAWANTLTVNLPTDTLYSAANNGVGVTVQSGAGTVTIPSYALSGIANTAGGAQVSITTTVNSAQQGASLLSGRTDVTAAQLANSSVTEVTMTSGSRSITSWGGRAITIDFPVSSASFTAGNRYTVYQISSNGSVETLTGYCSRQNGSLYVEVSTTHLSTFVVLPSSQASANASALPFKDVNTADWFYNEVSYVYSKGLFNGDSPTMFLPNDNMNRAMLVTVLHRLEGTPATTSSTGFTDVAAGLWYSNGVAWANSTGVVNGKGGGKFAPFDSITREEIAVILYRYAKIKGQDVSASANLYAFTDGSKTSDWATRAMQWANAKGIINGKGGGILDPGGYATRAEVAAMLMRFIESY